MVIDNEHINEVEILRKIFSFVEVLLIICNRCFSSQNSKNLT